MGGQIDMEQKGCDSIGFGAHYLTLTINLTHDLGLRFSMLNFQIAKSQQWEAKGHLTWNKRDVSIMRCWAH